MEYVFQFLIIAAISFVGELLSLLYADTRFEKVLRPLDVGLTFTSASLAQCFTGMRKKIAFPLLE